MAVKINRAILRKSIDAQANRVVTPRVSQVLNEKFEDEKNRLLSDFYSHPVTKEIESGPYAEKRGYGNLFSFLGFGADENPTADLGDFLEKNITKGRVLKEGTTRDNKLVYRLTARIPTLEEIKRYTQTLAWTERSWVDIVEKGAANFKKYVFDESGRFRGSRSGTAVQAKGDLRESVYNGRTYVSTLIEKFLSRLRRGNK